MILFWASLSLVGGLAELIIVGILDRRTIAVWSCSMGLAASALFLATGIALLRQSPRTATLAQAAALAQLLVLPLAWPLMGWPMRFLSLAFPLLLLGYFRKRPAGATA